MHLLKGWARYRLPRLYQAGTRRKCKSRKSASLAPVRWATASPMFAPLPAMTSRSTTFRRERIEAGLATINGNLARQVKSGKTHRSRTRRRDGAHSRARRRYEDFGDCDLVIEVRGRGRKRQAQDLRSGLPASRRACASRHQHLVDLDHPACRDRPTGRKNSWAFTS